LTFKIISLDHIVLNVSDVDRSLAFYVDGLGLEPVRLDEYRRGEVKFPSLRINSGTIIDLFAPKMRPSAAPRAAANLNHFCLVVDGDIDEIVARAGAMNAAIDEGPVKVFGARGDGRSIYISDPDDNKIELRSYA
jgi:catechol 2,3-dioxygenase-like lactoylglutathione lyase family enzyme